MMRYISSSLQQLRQLADGAAYGRAVLASGIDGTSSRVAIREATRNRAATFLTMVERTIFANPASPYRPLLEAAQYDLSRVRSLVGQQGVEGALATLRDSGVYITIEEFKGKRPLERLGILRHLDTDDFRNPTVGFGLTAWTGGSRGRRLPITISASNHRLGARHLGLALSAYGLDGAPVVVWLTYAHGASLWAVLALAAARHPIPRYFTHLPPAVAERPGLNARYLGIRAAALVQGIHLPRPVYLPAGQPENLVEWLAARDPMGCGVVTTPNCALRVALAARRLRRSLKHVTFITIAEPLTTAKVRAMDAVGARAFSSLGLTEFGRVTYGCAIPVEADDSHVCLDAAAVVQRRRTVDRFGTETDALLLTALQPDARQVLLNVETGDYATMSQRECGCPLSALGWTQHLEQIRSFEKLNAEGPPFSGSQLIGLVEDILPARFGGDLTDYQLLEEEDEAGFTRLSVLVHPRLGSVDEPAVLASAQETLWATHGLATKIWADAGTLQLRRAVPIMTAAGKQLALHHLGADRRRNDGLGGEARRPMSTNLMHSTER